MLGHGSKRQARGTCRRWLDSLPRMQHYERSQEFAKAEDALFAMLEAEPGNAGLVEFGVAFYERLRGQSDAALEAGKLPRSEL